MLRKVYVYSLFTKEVNASFSPTALVFCINKSLYSFTIIYIYTSHTEDHLLLSLFNISWFPCLPAWSNITSPPTALSMITIVGLMPETTYEIKMSAINGKGEGESSRARTFKTEPVRKYRPRRSSPCSQ